MLFLFFSASLCGWLPFQQDTLVTSNRNSRQLPVTVSDTGKLPLTPPLSSWHQSFKLNWGWLRCIASHFRALKSGFIFNFYPDNAEPCYAPGVARKFQCLHFKEQQYALLNIKQSFTKGLIIHFDNWIIAHQRCSKITVFSVWGSSSVQFSKFISLFAFKEYDCDSHFYNTAQFIWHSNRLHFFPWGNHQVLFNSSAAADLI